MALSEALTELNDQLMTHDEVMEWAYQTIDPNYKNQASEIISPPIRLNKPVIVFEPPKKDIPSESASHLLKAS